MNIEKNPFLKITNGYPVYTLKVLGRGSDKTKFQPVAQTVRELTTDPPKSIKHLNYDESQSNGHLIFKLRSEIPKKEIKEILGSCFPESARNFYIKPISGGFSGSYVFKVDYEVGQSTETMLLKIDKNRHNLINEYQFGNLKQLKELNEHFIHPYPSKLIQINDWFCLLFPYVSDTKTLRSHIKQQIKIGAQEALSVMEQVLEHFALFERKVSKPYFYKLKPWSGTKIDDCNYQGLSLKNHQKVNLLHAILKTTINIPINILENLGLVKSDLNALLNFIQSYEDFKFQGRSIDISHDSLFQKVPIAIVHGDLHMANILINDQGKISFIDFANVSTKLCNHAFLDMGKLSSELEISTFDFELNDWEKVKEFSAAHKQWMNNEAIDSDDESILLLYQLNSLIRSNLVVRFKQNMSEKEIYHQFYLVRLHYLFKAISYNQASREKLIFLMGLAVDILIFLTKK